MFGKNKKTKITVKLSEFELQQIKINAAERTLPVSDYLRLTGLSNSKYTNRAFRQQGRG